MAITRHARRAPRARTVALLTSALLLVAPVTPALAASPPSPASITSATPVLAATANAAKRRTIWQRRRAVVRFARRQLGKPYRWGGSGPNGYDCSGLTLSAWKRGGKSLPHSSRLQAKRTRNMSRRKMRIGDLLFYGNPVHHVAIYIGNGKTIEAPRRGLNVRKASAKRAGLRKIGRP